MKLIITFLVLSVASISVSAQSYLKDIRPIINANCVACHQANGAAPFSLETYEDVSKKAQTIVEVVRSGYMPPWMPDPSYTHFMGERGLQSHEIELIEKWATNGKKRGAGEAEPLVIPSSIFREDERIQLESLSVDTSVSDIYKFYIVPISELENRAIKAVRFNPGNAAVVHHAWVFADTLGFSLNGTETNVQNEFSDLGFPFTDILAAYLPGAGHTRFRKGEGKMLYGQSNLVVQVHYYSPNGVFSDASSISFEFTDEPIVNPVRTKLILETDLVDPPLYVPADQITNAMLSKKVEESMLVLRIAPHMHYRGKRATTFAVTPNSDTIPLIRINNWDFAWQGFYTFEQPVLIPAGSTIWHYATYDNTEANPFNPVIPPVDVHYGQGSLNEMCELAIEYVSVQANAFPTQREYFDMKKELKAMAAAVQDAEQESLNAIPTAQRYRDKVFAGDRSIETRLMLGLFSLFAGQTEEAIEVLLSLRGEQVVVDAGRFYAAVAHLIRAELDNCVRNHNDESCIMPFGPQAIHRDTSGSSQAIAMLESILLDDPDNLKARWILNVAQETLGIENSIPPAENEPNIRFTDVGGALGVNLFGYYGGMVMEDLDNDGLLDLISSSGSLEDNVLLFRNDGDGKFSNVTVAAGLTGMTGGANLIHADVNNDGLEDIYVIRGGWLEEYGRFYPNSLLLNKGELTFEDVTYGAGLLDHVASHTACFADFNLDGLIDLFVGNENELSRLYLNNGNGTFAESAIETDLECNAYVKGACVSDFDNNGFPDIYISVFKGENRLYMNQGVGADGQIKFSNEANERSVTQPLQSFVCTPIDFNNDGNMDILCGEYTMDLARYADGYLNKSGLAQNKLYINDGKGKFRDASVEVGINIPIEAMSVGTGDVNNDGFEDVFFGTGWPEFEAKVPNILLVNENGKRFRNETSAGLGQLQKGHGMAFGDIDNDGDQDIFQSLGGFFEANRYWDALYLNGSKNENNWVNLKLQGKKSNRSAIGARIVVTAKCRSELKKFHHTVGQNGSYSSSSLQAEMGLDCSSHIQKVEVTWPNGLVQTYKGIFVNNAYTLVEGESIPKIRNLPKLSLESTEPQKGAEPLHHHH